MPAPLTRLNLAAAVPDGPSAQTPIIPLPYQPIPQVHQQQLPLATLGDALSGFGNKVVSSMEALTRDDIQQAQHEARRSNEEYSQQAVADAQSGRDQNPELTGFNAYADTYSKVKGHNEGATAFETFYRDVGSKLGPGDDPAKALQEWQTNNPIDTGNPRFDGAAMAQFGARAQQWRNEFGRNAVQAAVNDGVHNWQTGLALTVQDGSLTPEKIQTATADFVRLNPMNAAQAGQAVIKTLVGQARTPEEARLVLNSLAADGSAGPGKSFAQQFPDAFASIDAQLAQRHGQVLTLAAAQSYDHIQEDIQNARLAPNPMEALPKILHDLDTTASRFGGNDRRLALRGQAEVILAKAAKTIAAVNTIETGRTDPVNRDVGVFTQHFDDFLKFRGINPLSGEQLNGSGLPQNIVAGSYVGSYNAIDGNTKANVSNAMLDATNLATQQRAVEFYKAAEGHVGRERVLALMTDESGKVYQAVADQPNLAQALSMRASNTPKGDTPTLEAITGKANRLDAETAFNTAVNGAINSHAGVNGWFSAGAAISPLVHSSIAAIVKQDAEDAARRGPVDLAKITQNALERHAASIVVLPGTDGRRVVKWMPDAPQMVPDPNKEGGMLRVVQAGRAVVNPATGKPEDTTATAEADIASLAERFPGRIGTRQGLSLAADGGTMPGNLYRATGLLTVTQGGNMVVFSPGDTLEVATPHANYPVVDGKLVRGPSAKIVVGDSGKALDEEVAKIWPNSPFTFVPIAQGSGKAYLLTYRHRFADGLPDAAARERAYQQGDAVQRNNDAVEQRRQQLLHPNNRAVTRPTDVPVAPSE